MDIIPELAGPNEIGHAALDLRNVVVVETSAWAYRRDALALTTTSTDSSGRIVDADVEVNAASGFTWADLEPGAESQTHETDVFDMQTVLTHEFGHFIGLAHTCYGEGSDAADMPAHLVDDGGNPILACSDPDAANSAAAEAVMWYTVDPKSTAKRVLTADDARGVCAIYPPNAAAPLCSANLPDNGCGCRTATRSGAARSATLALAALFAARRRRRRRR